MVIDLVKERKLYKESKNSGRKSNWWPYALLSKVISQCDYDILLNIIPGYLTLYDEESEKIQCVATSKAH